ncbi:hypothetical protein VOWphi5012_070 [Vibrio phage phi50-12]|uniref:TMhelix containing protein n=1 Tax=Vibrio phage phi50-12 TaxID=2654972 RepID=A0A5P8PRC2_9CAUD|nr:hypothetical protein KNU82_gp070 [Vibrio phage phi50-12]QFR59854.1 hypothetical protein VOWphi5012_070 [Vibrio phage phi50-12]
MFQLIASFFTGILSSNKAADTALDYLRKAGDLDDMNGKERAQWLLDYVQATKHQSPVRRFLAIVVTMLWAFLILSWAGLCFVGNIFDVEGAVNTAGLYFTMLKEVSPYFAGVMAFYFTSQIINSAKSK